MSNVSFIVDFREGAFLEISGTTTELYIVEFYDLDTEQPAGVVIRQAPEAGSTQTIGKSVTITINEQP